ncbi:MAG TPA: isoprenylcysteine carboxylmethyltransferase family protein [Anaerolineales bacterium]|nr:isoprenylcysteine carboxylmethyltransferase family protein [Anaerolineales bacterium]
MNTSIFHILFVIGFLSFMVVRMYYHRRARAEGGRMNSRDTRLSVILRIAVAIPMMIVLAAYMIQPDFLEWAAIGLPSSIRWAGAAMMGVSFGLLIWVQQALGANFNTILGVRERGHLVTHGPYRWVRHPMYTVLFLFLTGILLLTANHFVGGFLLAGFLVTIATRVDKEEAVLEEEYGEAYRSYKARTGRFVPRLGVTA